MAEQAEPSLTSVTLSLQPEQLARLARQLDKRSDSWREEWLNGTPTERLARRSKQLIDRVETLRAARKPATRRPASQRGGFVL